MSLESKAGWWLKTDAAISWTLALPGLVDPAGVATFFGAEEPSYGFLVRLWSGLLFMFGWVSWEASRNVAAQATLLKYIWIEKAIVTGSVLIGHLGPVLADWSGRLMPARAACGSIDAFEVTSWPTSARR